MEPPKEPPYHVEMSSTASEEIDAISAEAREAVHQALEALETAPRPRGARRRKAPHHYSLRADLYRILYVVDEEARLITIQRIRHRPSQRPHSGL